MSKLTDPKQAIRQAPPGTMTYGRFHTGEGAWQTGLFVREDRAHIRRLGRNPLFELHAGTFQEGDVYLIALLIRAGGVEGELYETWINYHQTGGGEQYLEDLAQQEELAIFFYDNVRRRRSIHINNPWREFAQESLAILRKTEPWSMEAFNAAREQLYQDYPTVANLWEAT